MSKVASAESLQTRGVFNPKDLCHVEEVMAVTSRTLDPYGAIASLVNAQMA